MESVETKAQSAARYMREYRARDGNKEKIKARIAADKAANPQKYYEYKKTTHRNHPETRLLALARARAKKLGREFDIDKSDIIVPDTCPVLGIKIFIGEDGFQDNSPTVDRIDSTGGYTKGNVIVVSWRANRIKCDATVEELKAIADFYERCIITQRGSKWRA